MPSYVALGHKPASLFIVAASAHVARRRVDRAVASGLDIKSLSSGLRDEAAHEFMNSHAAPDGKLHVWSIRDSPNLRRVWMRFHANDWVLFYSEGFFTWAAKVAATTESLTLARAVWGQASDAEEYPLMIAFSRVQHVEASAWKYRAQVGSRFLGFRRVSDDRRDALVRRFGSLDGFIEDAAKPD